MPSPSHNVYRQAQNLGGTPRQTEARALMEAARRLNEVRSLDVDREVYRKALRLNWRLWTIFQADVSEESNPLPADIKRNVLQLCVYIDRRTAAALSTVKLDILDTLIDINRNVALGLMGSASEGDKPAAAETASSAPAAPEAAGQPAPTPQGPLVA